MNKSTFRLMVVILLGTLVGLVAMGYFKLMHSKDEGSIGTLDVRAEELKEVMRELPMGNNGPIGFQYGGEEDATSIKS